MTHSKNEWLFWDKCAVSFLNLDILLNHRHFLGAKFLPWIFSWVKITFLSLTLSLSHAHSSSQFLSILKPLEYLVWSWMKYISQARNQNLHPTFSLSFLITLQNKKPSARKNYSVCIGTSQFCPASTHSSQCQPFMGTRWPPHIYGGVRGPKFGSDIKFFPTY